jgi:hypothetical protein
MKKIFTLFVSVLMTANVFAQAPQSMSYQAVIRNTAGALVTTQVGMRISILQTTSTGTAVYVETQTPTPNANGLVSLSIGTGTVVSGIFSTIDWSAGPYFIKTETDPAGATAYSITGTSQLLSVPYALYAAKSGDATSSNFVDLTTAQTIAGAKTFNEGLTVTNKPFLPTKLTQTQISGLANLEEGMVIYNTDTRKLQVYSVGNTDATNDLYSGNFSSSMDNIVQTYVPQASGTVYAFQFFAKKSPMNSPFADLIVSYDTGDSFNMNESLTTSAEWITMPVSSPFNVTAGTSYNFRVWSSSLCGGEILLGTNSNYSNGSITSSYSCGGGALNGDDLMFRVLITPSSSSAYWLNLN